MIDVESVRNCAQGGEVENLRSDSKLKRLDEAVAPIPRWQCLIYVWIQITLRTSNNTANLYYQEPLSGSSAELRASDGNIFIPLHRYDALEEGEGIAHFIAPTDSRNNL